MARITKWISTTNPQGKRDRNQRYFTTDAGIEVLRLRVREEQMAAELDALAKTASLAARIAELEAESEKLKGENENFDIKRHDD